MFVSPASSAWFEARCAQDVDAMLKRLEELGPGFKDDKQHKQSDDETFVTETSTVNESFASNNGNDDGSHGAPASDDSSGPNDENSLKAVLHGHHEVHENRLGEGLEDMPVEFVNMGLRGDDVLPSNEELQKLSNDELLVLLEQMRERLAKSLIDLSGERFLRRKKEKTLEKLAKELCKRVADGEMKEKQIQELTCSLKKTSETLCEIKKAEEKLKQECEALKDEHEATKREHKAQVDAQVANYTAKLQSLRESYNAELQNGQKLQDCLDDLESQHEKELRKHKKRTFVCLFLAAASLSVAFGLVDPIEVRDTVVVHVSIAAASAVEIFRDNMCSPVPLDFVLPNRSETYEAPWWAPLEYKNDLFHAVCGSRTRSRMHWDWINNKLSTHTLDKNGKARRLWTLRISNARVAGDKILIEGRNGKIQREIVAPWSA